MSILQKISALPMLLSEAEIVTTIDSILAIARDDPSESRADVADALADIMGRQSANYKPLDPLVCQRIEQWLLAAWSESPPDYFDTLGVIALMCNSQRGLEMVRAAMQSEDSEVRRIAAEVLEEALRDGQPNK